MTKKPRPSGFDDPASLLDEDVVPDVSAMQVLRRGLAISPELRIGIRVTVAMALVAAIRPKVMGSSTMGIKKSVVLTMPVPSPRSNTAASSRVSFPTISPGNDW